MAREKRFATKAVHAGVEPDPATGAIMTPVYLTSTYVQEGPGLHKGFQYSREQHPTRSALEACLASLEGGKRCLAFSSGSAAAAAVIQTLGQGAHVVSSLDMYGGVYGLFVKLFERFGVSFDFVDTTDLDAVEKALRPETRLIWAETPSNPLLEITDIRALAELSKSRGIRLALDNTFATPFLQRPLELGADIVVHSTTKYLGGHSDVVGGAVIVDDDGLEEELRTVQHLGGATPGPLDCFLVLRGVKTLPLRMERHCGSALKLARHLLEHPEVEKVRYPGLAHHPGYELAKAQMRLAGGIITFELKGGVERAMRMLGRTRVFSLAESLGGVESLIGHPATMSHGSVPREMREKRGLGDSMLRLSVGIEDPEDLIEDLDHAIMDSLQEETAT